MLSLTELLLVYSMGGVAAEEKARVRVHCIQISGLFRAHLAHSIHLIHLESAKGVEQMQ